MDSIVKNVREPYIGLFCRNLVQVRTDHTRCRGSYACSKACCHHFFAFKSIHAGPFCLTWPNALQVFFAVWQQREVQPQMRKLLSMWEGTFPQQLLSVLKQKTQQPALLQNTGLPRPGPSAQYQSNPQAQYQSNQWNRSQGPTHQPVPSGGRNGYPNESHILRQPARPTSASYQHSQNAYQHPANVQPGAQGRSEAMHAWRLQGGAPAGYAMTQQSGSQPLVLPHLLSSLLSSGLLTVPASVSIAPPAPQAAGPAVYYTHPPSRAATPEAVTAEGCNFVPSRLKVLSLFLLHSLLQLHSCFCVAGVVCIWHLLACCLCLVADVR